MDTHHYRLVFLKEEHLEAFSLGFLLLLLQKRNERNIPKVKFLNRLLAKLLFQDFILKFHMFYSLFTYSAGVATQSKSWPPTSETKLISLLPTPLKIYVYY